MSVEENKITIVDENGNEQLCEILFTFDSDQYNKSYVIYYPIGADQDDEDEIEIHASAFTPSEDGQDGELQPIETEEEWDMVEEMVNTFLDEEGE
ncbi:DUF1292 domain-containing protein [Priestia megaterium]|jgi:uncharacterized protein YrzB (UPF0473 family)|uniref:DUF1292 domain-containing protein n=1 Tax=Priestia megaterium TaxID=1404 RepID=UPI0007C470FA|nr:DUF1292 domain-containing protein [Priestia megaterium]MBU8584549.1 DUF1292 domain-containing protein [Priestia megaterium]MCI4624040.1 DUF1292 domain-containing protein [Priestia megaterium]MDP1378578.1 DUF1292 domain-containing protein [Priestia megaterium]MDP1426202.1 DUF1292 domain-containing protein [Priestia megaterium]MED4132877.1 DUF1292 domain-containing protein [Priestia megaterium]